MTKKSRPICPKCGEPAHRQKTQWGLRHGCCGLWSWGNHPLVCAETHKARKKAHAAFDFIWKSKMTSRGHAYALLAEEMGLTPQECHMKKMTLEQALRVPLAAWRVKQRLKPKEEEE